MHWIYVGGIMHYVYALGQIWTSIQNVLKKGICAVNRNYFTYHCSRELKVLGITSHFDEIIAGTISKESWTNLIFKLFTGP